MADYTTLINRIESRYNPDSLNEAQTNTICNYSGAPVLTINRG